MCNDVIVIIVYDVVRNNKLKPTINSIMCDYIRSE